MARIRLLLSATCVALMLTVQVAAENATVETACFKGQPKVELFDDITVIENEGYVVGFSAETRTPIWACYRFDSSGTTHDVSRPKGKRFATYSDGQIVIRHKDYSNRH